MLGCGSIHLGVKRRIPNGRVTSTQRVNEETHHKRVQRFEKQLDAGFRESAMEKQEGGAVSHDPCRDVVLPVILHHAQVHGRSNPLLFSCHVHASVQHELGHVANVNLPGSAQFT
jgi:hypothetical protein